MDHDYHRTSANLKSSYNNMAQPHHAHARTPPPHLRFPGASQAPHDDHYANAEHQPQRRRFEETQLSPSPQRHHPFPARGFDYRRPVMSASGSGMAAVQGRGSMAPDTIDLTGDGSASRSSRAQTPPGAASRPQRLPRFHRNIIDLDSPEELAPQQETQHPRNPWEGRGTALDNDDSDSLFIPEAAQLRPTMAGLRRPGFMRQPSPVMDLDDVQVTGSRPISRAPSHRATPNFMSNRTGTPANGNNADATIDLTAADDDDDDDDVVYTNTRPLPSINGDRPAMAGSGIGVREQPLYGAGMGRLIQHFRRQGGEDEAAFGILARFGGRGAGRGAEDDHARMTRIREMQRITQHNLEAARAHTQTQEERFNRLAAEQRLRAPAARTHAPRNRILPTIDMDYGVAAFDLGLLGGGMPARPPTPKYEPPAPAKDGFTRSPEEDEEVVCPNCGDELAVGKDEIKQQIWVNKPCGHAYCGECATRSRVAPRTSKKGKGKAIDPSIPPPLKKCVVVGCEMNAGKKDLIHVYMSS